MEEATKGFTNIMAGHHDLHVATEPYNSDLTASLLQIVFTEKNCIKQGLLQRYYSQRCMSPDTTVILGLLWEFAMWLNGIANMTP